MSAMKDLLEEIAKALVDNPEDVQVTEVEGEQTTVLELRVRYGGSRQSHRPPGPHRSRDPDPALGSRHEGPQALRARDPRVASRPRIPIG